MSKAATSSRSSARPPHGITSMFQQRSRYGRHVGHLRRTQRAEGRFASDQCQLTFSLLLIINILVSFRVRAEAQALGADAGSVAASHARTRATYCLSRRTIR